MDQNLQKNFYLHYENAGNLYACYFEVNNNDLLFDDLTDDNEDDIEDDTFDDSSDE